MNQFGAQNPQSLVQTANTTLPDFTKFSSQLSGLQQQMTMVPGGAFNLSFSGSFGQQH
jgi:hypothetical protein